MTCKVLITVITMKDIFIFQFEKRNGSTRAEVVHDAIQVANIADLVYHNYVSIVYFIIHFGHQKYQIFSHFHYEKWAFKRGKL